MKFVVALASFVAAASALSADSEIGRHLLSQSRNLDQNQEAEYAWVADYSVKFQGCHHIKQWNEYADENEDVKISTKRLIRYRLCPSSSCSDNKAAGCKDGYGDYVTDMDTFMDSWFEAQRKQIEGKCQKFLYYQCDCQDSDDKGDDFNAEYCEYDCFNNAGRSECIDRNPYVDDQGQEEEFNLEEYMGCAQIRNDNNAQYDADGNQIAYYVGPYCSAQGGEVRLGLFTDDTCSEFAESITFKSLMGFELPYSGKSIVTSECVGCIEPQNPEDQDNWNDAMDADEVIEQCENLYMSSGKCESHLPSGTVYQPNNAACNYMEGIKVVRQDGIIDTGSTRPNAVATAFAVIFAMAFCAMAFYVWYLRTRLGVKRNSLL